MTPAQPNVWIYLAATKISPVLALSSAEVVTLNETDLAILRDDLGMTEAMLGQLRALAAVPGRALLCHFDEQRVEVVPVDSRGRAVVVPARD